MRIETLEQRVAATPAVLLCDDCVHADICQWVGDMRKAVVNTKELCKNAPFHPSGWTCRYFLNKDIWNQVQTTAVPLTEDLQYGQDKDRS